MHRESIHMLGESPLEEAPPVSLPLIKTPEEEVQSPICLEFLTSEPIEKVSECVPTLSPKEIDFIKVISEASKRQGSVTIPEVFQNEAVLERYLRDYTKSRFAHLELVRLENWMCSGHLSQISTVKDAVRLLWEEGVLSDSGYDLAIQRGLLPEPGTEPETEEQPGQSKESSGKPTSNFYKLRDTEIRRMKDEGFTSTQIAKIKCMTPDAVRKVLERAKK